MRLGFALPQAGKIAGPEALSAVATRAEEMGYDDLWVLDRVLWPVRPKVPYPASADGRLPERSKRVLDPLDTLAFVAARTQRIRLGTSVINLPYYNPVLLARRLATVDVLSNGRLTVGFGTGWSEDEFEAVHAPMEERGLRCEEAVAVLEALWTEDVVSFSGRYFRVAESIVDLKPVQKPHPPLFWAAYTPAAMKRIARTADGWMPAGVPIAAIGPMFASLRDMARAAGRNPDALQLVVRANLEVTAAPLGDARGPFHGTPEQIRADVDAVRSLGADGLIFDVQFTAGSEDIAGMIEHLERVWALAH